MDWDRFAEGHLDVAHEVLTTLRPTIEAVAAKMVACLKQGGKILVCGNGGRAADAQQFAAELVNDITTTRKCFPSRLRRWAAPVTFCWPFPPAETPRMYAAPLKWRALRESGPWLCPADRAGSSAVWRTSSCA